jgi:hypothetical protein
MMMDRQQEHVTAGAALAAIDQERSAWEDLLGRIGESRMLEPGPMGEWSLKDLLAHLAAWSDRRLDRLEAAAHGQDEPAPSWPAGLDDEHAINEWVHGQTAERLLGEVVEEFRQGFARLAAVVQMLPEDALNDPRRFPWLEGESVGSAIVSGSWFSHWHDEHEQELREWLERSAAGA